MSDCIEIRLGGGETVSYRKSADYREGVKESARGLSRVMRDGVRVFDCQGFCLYEVVIARNGVPV